MSDRESVTGRFFQRGSLRFISTFALKLFVAGAFLCFVGGLSLPASVAIILLLALVGIWSWERPSANFTLYKVKIIPRIGVMLGVLGLIEEEAWNRLSGKRLAPAPCWTALHLERGITALVIYDSTRGRHNQLVHWMAGNTETGKGFPIPQSYNYTLYDGGRLYDAGSMWQQLEFWQRLDFLTFRDSSKPEDDCFNWSPAFYFDQDLQGYEIGIEVPTSWWNENKARIEQLRVAKRVHSETGRFDTRIALAVLPFDIFALFNARECDRSRAENFRERVVEDLMREGWKVENIRFGSTEKIEHEIALLRNFGESYVCPYADVSVKPLNV